MWYIWDFMGEHPFLTFILFYMFVDLCARILRVTNILVRGWPPAHLDADGDFNLIKTKEEVDEA